MFDVDKELVEVKNNLIIFENKLNEEQQRHHIEEQQIDHLLNELNHLKRKEVLLLEIKLVQEYSKLSAEVIPIMKEKKLLNHSLLSSLLNSEDAGKELERKGNINYFTNYVKSFSPSSISRSSSNHSLSQASDLDLSSHSTYSLTEITSLNDRFEKEALGLRCRTIVGLNSETKEPDNADNNIVIDEKKNYMDDSQSLLKSIIGITEIDNEFLWNFEI